MPPSSSQHSSSHNNLHMVNNRQQYASSSNQQHQFASSGGVANYNNESNGPKMTPATATYQPESTFSRVSVVLRLRPVRISSSSRKRRKRSQASSGNHQPAVVSNSNTNGTPIPSLKLHPSRTSLQFQTDQNSKNYRMYHYDRVFASNTSQEQIFRECGIIQLLDQLLEKGLKSSVFAYGQTGSGKTHTTIGKFQGADRLHRNEGLVPRSVRYLFERKQDIEAHGLQSQLENDKLNRRRGSSSMARTSITVRASFLEIYNETCNDLLNIHSPAGRNLPVRFNDDQGFYVENLFVIQCDSLEDILAVLEEGLRNRKVAEHELNADSSRSHSIFTIYTEVTTSIGGYSTVKRGKMNIVDLCGSEKLKKSQSAKHHRTETRYINKSLLTLGQVISSLSDPNQKDRHIRYRDSKLTCLLSDSLGGSSACIMIATITPTMEQLDETVNTLNYANKAKSIQNNVQTPEDTSDDVIVELQKQIAELKEENKHLKQQREATPTDSGMRSRQEHQRHSEPSSPGPNNALRARTPTSSSSTRSAGINKTFSLRNPLHPNAGVRNLPTKLKPISERPRRGLPPMSTGTPKHTTTLDSPIFSPLDSPRSVGNGALTDRSDMSEAMPAGGHYPLNARFGRMIAERDRMQEEIRVLKSKLDSNRDPDSARGELTPRRDLLVRPPSTSSVSSNKSGAPMTSPIKRRYKSFLEEENKILKERIHELESNTSSSQNTQVKRLKQANKELLQLLKDHDIPFDEHLEMYNEEDEEDEIPKKPISSPVPPPPDQRKRHVNRRPRRPVNVAMPQLPTLHRNHVSSDSVDDTLESTQQAKPRQPKDVVASPRKASTDEAEDTLSTEEEKEGEDIDETKSIDTAESELSEVDEEDDDVEERDHDITSPSDDVPDEGTNATEETRDHEDADVEATDQPTEDESAADDDDDQEQDTQDEDMQAQEVEGETGAAEESAEESSSEPETGADEEQPAPEVEEAQQIEEDPKKTEDSASIQESPKEDSPVEESSSPSQNSAAEADEHVAKEEEPESTEAEPVQDNDTAAESEAEVSSSLENDAPVEKSPTAENTETEEEEQDGPPQITDEEPQPEQEAAQSPPSESPSSPKDEQENPQQSEQQQQETPSADLKDDEDNTESAKQSTAQNANDEEQDTTSQGE